MSGFDVYDLIVPDATESVRCYGIPDLWELVTICNAMDDVPRVRLLTGMDASPLTCACGAFANYVSISIVSCLPCLLREKRDLADWGRFSTISRIRSV